MQKIINNVKLDFKDVLIRPKCFHIEKQICCKSTNFYQIFSRLHLYKIQYSFNVIIQKKKKKISKNIRYNISLD